MPTSPIIQQRIAQIENEYRARLRAQRVQFRDQYAPLPADLQRRVHRILHGAQIGRIEEQRKEQQQQQQRNDAKTRTALGEKGAQRKGSIDDEDNGDDGESVVQRPKEVVPFNESTVSLILDQQLRHPVLQLHIESPPESRRPSAQTVGWLANMLRQRRSERVCWPTKLYHFDRKFSAKSLFQQAEQMTELCAENFADWLADLGNDHEVTITKDIVMQLFSIGVEGDSAKALCVEPRQCKAVPHDVAIGLGQPEISIERNVARLLRTDRRDRERSQVRTVAFGRTLPADMYRSKVGAPCVPPLVPKFPDALHTKRAVFEGITHLRSTKQIVQHMLEREQHGEGLRRPDYLVESGCFKAAAVAKVDQAETPLYAHFIKAEI